MIYDMILDASSISVSEKTTSAAGNVYYPVSVSSENNSYMPQEGRFVRLFLTTEDKRNTPSEWRVIYTVSGKEKNELSFAYPMQRAKTMESFVLPVEAVHESDKKSYLIAWVNDEEETLSHIPENGVAGLRGTDDEDCVSVLKLCS